MGTEPAQPLFRCICMRMKGNGEVVLLFPFHVGSLPGKQPHHQMAAGPFLAAPPSPGVPPTSCRSWGRSPGHGAQEGARAHLVFLLEAVALGTLHLRDVL